MLDPITMLIIKTIASACIRFYFASLLSAGQITYDSDELGYTVPKWYMNPGRASKVFYAYGTSVAGDEFESLQDAHRRAINQMAQHIRLSNRALVKKEIRYDANSVKQRRLIELFVRGGGLEDFIRINAKLDKKQLVRVSMPEPDMRAFVRIQLKTKTYLAYQTKWLNELKTRLTQQKTEDILGEMQAELAAWEKEATAMPSDLPPEGFKPGDISPPTAAPIPELPGTEVAPPAVPAPHSAAPTVAPASAPKPTAGGPWSDMEDELDKSRAGE